MDLLKTLKDKCGEMGNESVAKEMGVPQGLLSQFISEKKSPGLKICQKIIDLWGNSESGDGSIGEWTVDQDGITNGSYCPAEWGRKKAAWDGRDVCLCLPIIDEIPQAAYYSVLAIVMKYRMALRMELRGDDSMIARSRNHLARRFLRTGATWSIWFDSDMVLPMGNSGIYATLTNMRNLPDKFLSLSTIERLISWNRTVVGGCYWDRRGGGRLIAGGGPPIMNPIPSDILHPVDFIGTGCLAVHRQVFLDIAIKFPETYSDESLGNECGFFTSIQTPHRMLGEDESFAKRATNAGHPSYLDLGLLCGHVGSSNVHGMPQSGSKI